MAKMSGVPKPPFRIIAPKGAPMRNKIIHASDNVILRCHSIECLRIERDLSSSTVRRDSALNLTEEALLFAVELQLTNAVSGNSCLNVFLLRIHFLSALDN